MANGAEALIANFDPLSSLTRDLKAMAKGLSVEQVRFLVDSYYSMQDDRKRADNQVRALSESGEPSDILAWLGQNTSRLERNIKIALDVYSSVSGQ